jgi:CheY-like chemotaxis protein
MKILIVDDDPGAAERLAAEVAAAGFGPAFAATSAEEAAQVVNAERGIDVLATQVFLEGIDGFTLAESIRDQLPDLRTIFLSEYDLSEHAGRVGDSPVLARPASADALVAEIRRMVEPAEPVAAPPALPDLIGATVGTYRIEKLLGEDLDGPIYQAVQTTIGRSVEFHILAAEQAVDSATIERFLANARAKANVHHPALLSVFEAGESAGIYFYTSELRQGDSLWELARLHAKLTPAVLLQLLHTVAEVMVHLGQVKTAHEPLHAVHVIVDQRYRARLVNIATSEPMGNTARADMLSLATAIEPLVLAHPSSAALHQLLADIEGGSLSVRSWTALIYEVKRCTGAGAQPAYHLDADGRAEIEAVGEARRRHRRGRKLVVCAVVVVLLAAGAGVWLYLHGGALS